MLVMLFPDYTVVVDYGLKYVCIHITFWVRKHVWLIGMTCLIMNVTFKRVKLHVLTKCPFLACFDLTWAYGLILSISGVLTPFSPFSQTLLGSGFWRLIWEYLKKNWIFSTIIDVDPYYPRAMPIFGLWGCFFSITIMFVLLSFEYILYRTIRGFFTLM